MSPEFDDCFTCPVCGAEVPLGRLSCPECGADERTGWGDSDEGDGADPEFSGDDDFDYEQFLRKEGFSRDGLRPDGIRKGWWLVAIIALFAFLVLVFGGR